MRHSSTLLYIAAANVAASPGPNLQNFVSWTFAILSQFFRMSANKLSYQKFTKELRTMYDRLESYKRVTNSLQKVYETICNSLMTFL